MRQIMHVPPQKLADVRVTKQTQRGPIGKGAVRLEIEPVDGLRRGVEQQARSLFAFAQGRFGLLTHGYFLPQFGCSLFYAKLEFVAGLLQISVAALNLREHPVETINQYAGFIRSEERRVGKECGSRLEGDH